MWPDARNSFAFLWISVILAPREHSTIVFPLQTRDNFLHSIFLTSESPIRQAFVGLSALISCKGLPNPPLLAEIVDSISKNSEINARTEI